MPERPEANEIRREYQQHRPKVVAFTELMVRLITQLCNGEGIPFQDISGRPKELDSLLEKWKRHSNYQSLDDIRDQCGLRVITYYQSDMTRVQNLMKRELTILEEERHGAESAETFGYTSMHLIAQLDDRRQGLPEYASYEGLVVEIQVRTVLQHAWAAISHKLDYKSEAEVPDASRRKLFRVAALLETGDDLFESYRRDAETLRTHYVQLAKQDGWRDLELNLDTLQLAWRRFPLKGIRERAVGVGFAPLSRPLSAAERRGLIGRLVLIASSCGIRTIGELFEVAKQTAEEADDLGKFAKLATRKGHKPVAVEPDVIVMKLVLNNPRALVTLSTDAFYPPLMAALRELVAS